MTEHTQPTHEEVEMHGRSALVVEHPVRHGMLAIVLVALTALTLAISFIPLSNTILKTLLMLCIATVQGIVVTVFMMGLRFESKLIRFIMIVPIFLSILLIIALIPDIMRGHLFNFGSR